MADPAARIRVLVVDDHPLMRIGLRSQIDAEPDLQVVAEAGDGPSAIAAHEQHRPDITLLDLRLPGMDGPQIITIIRERDPAAKIIILTTYDADEDVYRAVQAGARGYLLKGTFPEGIMEAIRHVNAGRRLIAPEVASRLAERVSSPGLSSREIAVLELVAKGMSNKEIGAALFVTAATVKYHLKNIYLKLDASDRTEAALIAAQRGIIVLG
jgi:two-component system NarL family response regulator